jgi:peroxiredoxin
MNLQGLFVRTVFDATTLFLDLVGGGPPQPGEKAPSFDRMSTRGRVRLLDFIAEKRLVLLFPPGDTSDLWIPELLAFQRRLVEFRRLHAAVVAFLPVGEGEGRDLALRYGIDFPLVYDPERTIAKRYGGGNGAWVVDEEGIVRLVQRERPAVAELLRVLEELED